RVAWMKKHGIELSGDRIQTQISRLPKETRCEYYRLFSARWAALLDNCYGSCPLREPARAKVVADSLLFFDNDRYLMTDFVVMPNHVHLLAAFDQSGRMLKQCESWKHFTATQLNRMIGRKGHFWETESFDHLVRSEAQWLRFRRYILENPPQAKLRAGEFIHYS